MRSRFEQEPLTKGFGYSHPLDGCCCFQWIRDCHDDKPFKKEISVVFRK